MGPLKYPDGVSEALDNNQLAARYEPSLGNFDSIQHTRGQIRNEHKLFQPNISEFSVDFGE